MRKCEQMAVLYLFREEDKRSADTRMQLAAEDYCRRCGIPLAQEEKALEEVFQIARTERGKPYFSQCPQIQFSISHSGAYWVCALAVVEIGVDLQEHVKAKGETTEGASIRFRKMAHRFFHPLEAEFVEEKCYENFFDVWSAREAYVKYTGQGIDREFSEHCVVPAEKELWAELFGGTEPVTWQAQGVWFTKMRYKDAYSLCFCTKEKACYTMIDFSDN